MPKKVHDLVRKLTAKGMQESKAWPIAYTIVTRKIARKVKRQKGKKS